MILHNKSATAQLSCIRQMLTGTGIKVLFSFVKQKTAYEIVFVDWSSNVCSSDLRPNLKEPSVILKNPKTDIGLRIYTTQPGIQFYTPLKHPQPNESNIKIPTTGNWAICLEPQHFPNSPNNTTFPTTLLTPNEEYNHTTILCFDLGE